MEEMTERCAWKRSDTGELRLRSIAQRRRIMFRKEARISRMRWSLVLAVLLFAASAQARWEHADVPFYSTSVEAAGWSRYFHPNAPQALAQLPQGVQTMLMTEIADNPWIRGHEEMAAKLKQFRPEAQQVFELPYIPIPAAQMKVAYDDPNMTANTKANVRFIDTDGVEKVRFFYHPLYAHKYKELIEAYGARYGEYWSTPTSSPRSLVAWRKDAPGKPIWVKVSLHAHLDYYTRREADGTETKIGISRVQSAKKAHRSALVNSAFSSANNAELRSHGIEYMPEPASYVPGDIQVSDGRGGTKRVGFDRATIFREIPKALTAKNSATEYLPAFAFIKRLRETAQRNGKDPLSLLENGLMEPLVRSYLYLGLEHGLQGEMHTQNFLLEVRKETGLPTGKIMVKDLDGYRMDLDMRIRNGKDIGFLENYSNPFEWAKHSATQGSSQFPAVLHAWFNKLIRNVNGFTTERNGETVYATPAGQIMQRLKAEFPTLFTQLRQEAIAADPRLANDPGKADRKAVERVFDRVAKREFRAITGIEIPAAKWGFGQKKGLNFGLQQLRKELSSAQAGTGLETPAAQTVLKETWAGLRTAKQKRTDNRTWGSLTAKKFRLLGDGVIEGLSATGKHAGYAILRQGDVQVLGRKLTKVGVQMPQRVRAATGLASYALSRPFAPVQYRSARPAPRRSR